MVNITIGPFAFKDLTHSEYFELTHHIFVTLTPSIAETLGIEKAYNEAKSSYDKLADIFRRNPTLLKTEKLKDAIMKTRRRMTLFKNMLREKLVDEAGEQLDNAKVIENLAHPYLKDVHRDTQAALIANAMEMADALRTSANQPLLVQLRLNETLDDLVAPAYEADEILRARGEEKAYRKAMGNASDAREKNEKQLRFLLYISLPAHYAEATGTQAAMFEHIIIDINGALDTFRHLVSGSRGGNWAGDGNYEGSGDPGQPDTQPASPPNGGTYIDPNA